MAEVLIAEQNIRLRRRMIDMLNRLGLSAYPCSSASELVRCFQDHRYGLVIIGSRWAQCLDGLEMLTKIQAAGGRVPVIVVSEKTSETIMIGFIKCGICDFIKVPFKPGEFMDGVRNALKLGGETSFIPTDQGRKRLNTILGESRLFRKIRTYLQKVAMVDSNVLIYGETGTGKDVATQFIYENSSRNDKELVSLNCAALPETLIESELFGYERGAFTGAVATRPGKFELADQGILFLDEIGDMSLQAQAKLLRIIESKEVYRLGAIRPRFINTRIIAATNRNPEWLVSKGKFRQDLYYRLNVARVNIPPLRERKEDLPILIDHFLEELNESFDCTVSDFSSKAWAVLLSYEWPGNIRELKNVLEATFINRPDRTIHYADFPPSFIKQIEQIIPEAESERTQLLSALISTNWNKTRAAEKLKWSRMTLYRKMEKYSIVKNRPPRTMYKLSHSPDPPPIRSFRS